MWGRKNQEGQVKLDTCLSCKTAQQRKRQSLSAVWVTTWTNLSFTSLSLPLVRISSPNSTHSHTAIRRHRRSPAPTRRHQPHARLGYAPTLQSDHSTHTPLEIKHRGFAFVTYASPADAQDAIDNMDLNELHGRVIKVNIARPFKATIQPGAGNRASKYFPSHPLPV